MSLEEPTENTQPVGILPPDENTGNNQKPKRWPWILLGIGLFILIVGLGVVFGYSSALRARLDRAQQTRIESAAYHFQYGMEQMSLQNYELALIQFEYVIQLDSSFPGAIEQLAQAQINLATARTPTPEVSPTPSPTPDTRGVDEMFAQAQQHLRAMEWQEALDTLSALRDAELMYRVVDVDGMYYQAFRSRGIELILGDLNRNIPGGSLEEGLYDLSLAEHFAPLDGRAQEVRAWARRYITAAVYWGINWEEVVNQFDMIRQAYPNLSDSSGMTAMARYIEGLWRFGDYYMGIGDYCNAANEYSYSLELRYNVDVETKMNEALNACYGPTLTSQAAVPTQPTISVTTTEPIASETPVPSESPSP